jgi:hypothetical protein
MGNKLDAARIALEKGYTGVSDPTSTLSAISKGMQDVASWKKGIDDAEVKLKTDTAKAYQDAKKLASERMTGNKTVDAAILEALQSTQDRLYDNQRMVQKGMQTPTDNLIFRQNASSSYDTLSSFLQDYDANFQQSLKEMQGYTDKEGNYIKPTGGSVQAAIQKFQTTLGNPNLYKIVSSENGSLNMNLYKTKINTNTNTRELVLDDDGNPVVDPTMSGIGASALLKGKNQKAPRVYMDDNINKAVGKDTALGKAFQVMQTAPGYTGIVVDDARNNPQVNELVETATISGTATPEQVMSILMDNMPAGMEQIAVMPNEVEALKAQGINLDEKVEYTYLNPATGKMESGTYDKYQKLTLDPMSTIFIPEGDLSESEIAAKNIYKSRIYAALQKKITGKDKTTTFAPKRKLKDEKENEAFGDLIKKAVLGDSKSFESLLRNSGYKSNILEDGKIQFVDQDNRRVGEPLSFNDLNARDTAIQLASIFGVSPEVFDDKIKFNKNQKVQKGGLIQFGEAPEVRIDLSTNIRTNKDKLTVQQSLLEASQAANEEDLYGFNGSVLADGIESTIGQALQKTNQNLNSSPRVTYDKKNETMTVTAVNSKGKTITISKSISDDIGEDKAISKKADAFVMEFLSNINSSKDYSSGGSEKKVDAFGNPIN